MTTPTPPATEERPRATDGTRLAALGGLLLVTVIWGWTFVWMKEAQDAVLARLGTAGILPATGLFVTLRFALPALLLPLILPSSRRRSPGLVPEAGLLGLFLLSGFLLQMTALADVSPAVSAFLTSLYVAFTALLALGSRAHRRMPASLLVGVVLATLGAAFISGPPQLEFDLAEWLTVASALLFAGTILLTDGATRRHAPAAVSLVSFTAVALGAGLFTAWALTRPGAPDLAALLAVLGDRPFLVALLACSLLATLLALSLINHFQRRVSPVRAATIYALEPVWAAVISLGYGLEAPDAWLVGGALALLAGNLVAELGPRRRAAA